MSETYDDLDRYLEGEISVEELSEELRAEEETLRGLLEAVRDETPASPSLRVAVMREIRDVREPAWRRLLAWFFQPRTIRLSPATGALAMAAVAAALLLVPFGERPAEGGPEAGTGENVVTRFVFIAPEASSVQITGDFVDWNPEGIALKDERATGVWTVDVPLEPGVYQYGFVVDGVEWRPDPRAVSTVDDGFGRENSVVIVSEENAT
ncbi:MAG: isoamylase early set domain-containing protein [Longimicrobiales bacterium]|nr:isoamylase early set domain-containing protein [Longimicrobiales bacterium]